MKRTLGLTLLLFATLFSCTRQEKPLPAELSRAESVMWEHPDSALLCLSSLDSSIMNEPENIRMYHALLKIKAKDKLYIPHESDSLIKSIVQYYEDYGTPDQLMEAYYYLGSTYRDMGDAPRAVRAFQDAADIGKDSKRYDILGRVYEQMGYRLAYQGLYDEALEAYRKSYEYKMYDKGKGEVIALRNIARIYNAKQDTDSAIYYYQSAYEKALLLNDQSRIDNVLRELSSIYIDMGKYDLAKDLFSKVSSMKDQANIYFGLGCIYESYKQIDSALYYFEKANEYGNIYMKKNTYRILSKIKNQEGDRKLALNYAYKCIELSDSIKNQTKTEAVAKVNSLYKYQHTEKENVQLKIDNEKRKIRNYQFALFVVLIIFFSLCYIYVLEKKKKAAIEKEKKIRLLKENQYAESLDCIEYNNKKISYLEELLQQSECQRDNFKKQLVQSQKELLELSNRKILTSQNEKSLLEIAFRKSEVYRLFHETSNNTDTEIQNKDWKELRKEIDTTYSNFTAQLYALYPQISELELHICYLIKISMPVKDIARLVGRSTPAITASRIRLYKKIHGTEGTAEMMDKFIADL